MTYRAAAGAFVDVLKTSTLQVKGEPPRQIPGTDTIFFGGMRRYRSSQDGTTTAVIDLFIVVNTNGTWSLNSLYDHTETVETIIDEADLGTDGDVCFHEDSDWALGWHEIGGQFYYGAATQVALSF